MTTYNIVLVDDHLLIAKAIANVISEFPNYKVLYEAEHGKALMEKFNNPKNIPHIVLLDISMPVMDGFATAEWLQKNHPKVHVLVLSMQDDEYSLIRMLKYGVKGYLLKNIHPWELQVALDTLIDKGHFYSEWLTSKIMLSTSGDPFVKGTNEFALTDRELDFLKLCCSELTYKEISEKMNCSARTVEGYRDTLFKKLDLKTRVGLVMYAIKSGKCTF
ncbi:MAG: DNA-binding response regulator [Flavipsychrobacter sp.]|nr:DNA-binding response regulator [Flavipsychrobacter sp.]